MQIKKNRYTFVIRKTENKHFLTLKNKEMKTLFITKVRTTILKNSCTSTQTIEYFYKGVKFIRTIVRATNEDTPLTKEILSYHEQL